VKLKKLIIVSEVLILFIILAKIATIGGILKNSEAVDFFSPVARAVAEPLVAEASVNPGRDLSEDSLSEERKLLSSLVKKQKALEDRENFLKSEERRLNSLSEEILSEINRLSEIEGRIIILLERVKEMDNKKYKSLAIVYESTPPEKAGSMLEKLDSKEAAAIIMNMKGKKAGAIWGNINPSKAAEITREILKSGKTQK
jgi:flagellar motility protein MotE (MotC chaperone)